MTRTKKNRPVVKTAFLILLLWRMQQRIRFRGPWGRSGIRGEPSCSDRGESL